MECRACGRRRAASAVCALPRPATVMRRRASAQRSSVPSEWTRPLERITVKVNKPGLCPSEQLLATEQSCRRECTDDADCRGVGKCCASGCSQLCVAPLASATTPYVPSTTGVPGTYAAHLKAYPGLDKANIC
ncbi:hypothetical protein JYU34_018868 [Plutella xylostella]|uniref:WAP domain-containing protein n=1 Tax=Plutella xylostella TaxID=51655 RepID=A0ABQ7PYX3_PLUXY|nr:hypothetical protein JYU34_018868 [Plutella xylostella]